MTGRTAVLGSADVDDDALAGMVAAQLGVDEVEVTASRAEVVPYDLPALTTGGRFWVQGTARHGRTEAPYAFFVKLVQSWARSPLFDFVPPGLREHALATVPWRREPDVYRSDLHNRLPEGLRLPRSFGVFDIDDMSASVWLAVVDAEPVHWDMQRHAAAARLLGRLAARGDVAPIAELGAVPRPARTYASGRVQHAVAPALLGDEIWTHPLVADTFDVDLRDRLRAATAGLPEMLDELDAMPVGTLHGDACTRNLLVERGSDGFVLIDFGFWGRGPFGFDLTQLVFGEVQMGERPAGELPELDRVCLAAYVEGLRDEGTDVPAPTVARAHALLALLFTGLSAVPLEHLGEPVTDELLRVARERAAAARFLLDLVDATAA